jgi:AcrR family transcriptional regulator
VVSSEFVGEASEAGVPVGPDRDLTAEARIRRSALRLFAEQGYSATTTRSIAAGAGVSPGLVLHHFGTKDNLRDHVDRDAMATVNEIFASFTPEDALVDFTAFITGYARLFAEHPDITAYMRRSLLEPSAATSGLLSRILGYIEGLMVTWIERGAIEPPSDIRATAALQASLGLTSILFGPSLHEYLGTDEPIETRLARAEVELLTHRYFIDDEETT